jgi:hypothetical protein
MLHACGGGMFGSGMSGGESVVRDSDMIAG